jgi:exonuclease III
MNVFLTGIFYFFTFLSFPSINAECSAVTTITDRRLDNSTFRLVQYNAEWLFIDYYSSAKCPGSGCSWHTLDEAETHLLTVSNVLSELNADLVNICEVEGCNELDMLIGNLDNTYKPYLIKGTDTSTGQNVGMITRIDPNINLYRSEERVSYPIQNTKCGTTSSSGTTGVSKHYITEMNIFGMNVALISAHLLAIPTDPGRCVQREGQAQVLQNIIYSYILKNYEIIVMGDMNDYDMETLDMNSNKPISRVLDILKGIEGDKMGTYLLSNVANLMNQQDRYSDWWDSDNNCNTESVNDYSMIDHVLVSYSLEKRIKNVFMYHNYTEYCGKINSDHYPVVIDFR